MGSAPALEGIHHLKLPVSDLERSLAWYQERLGYEVMHEFVEDGVRMGVAMTHPNGGPDFAVAARSRNGPEPRRGSTTSPSASPARKPSRPSPPRSRERGDPTTASSAHRSAGSSLGVQDPDGHAVRFYTVPLELPPDGFGG